VIFSIVFILIPERTLNLGADVLVVAPTGMGKVKLLKGILI
jgi:hypothetical protein